MTFERLHKQVAEQIGVDVTTLTNWESNRTVPAIRYFPSIILLGYNPFPPGDSLREKLTTARKVRGLSRRKLAKRLGVDESTLAGWETERHQPTKKFLGQIGAFLGEPKP
jgi:transcriptional regulator with XRE-family HTH domain